MRCLRYLWIPTSDDRMIGAIAQMSNVCQRCRTTTDLSTWARIDWRRRPGVASHRCRRRHRRLSRPGSTFEPRRETYGERLAVCSSFHTTRNPECSRALERGWKLAREKERMREREGESERESARGESTLSLPGKVPSRAHAACDQPLILSPPPSASTPPL